MASFSLKKYGSEKAHLALEWTRRKQWKYDTYVTQDEEAFEYSDGHFACYTTRQIGRLSCVLCQPETVRGHQHSSACVDKYAIVVRVTR